MRSLFYLGLACLWALPAAAQSSSFSARGLGYPGRGDSPRAQALGGAFGLFDGLSPDNPAALQQLQSMMATFTLMPEWRSTSGPLGGARQRDTRFPLFLLAGPIKGTRFALGFSYTTYTDRNFTLASVDTAMVRGQQVLLNDTLVSNGGINDLRLAASYRLGPRTAIGGSVHLLTGINRMRLATAFPDTTYQFTSQHTELSYAGVGFSLGLGHQVSNKLSLALMIRSDDQAGVDRDSVRVGNTDLPYAFAAGVRYQANPKLMVVTAATYRTWSAANSDLIVQGGVGAKNTLEAGVGVEYTPNPEQPGRKPLRLGLRYAQLPFLLMPGDQPHEFGATIGSGIRFARGRGALDASLERTWRRSATLKESAWILSLGVTVRPNL